MNNQPLFVFRICIFLYSYIFIMRKKKNLELYIFWKEFSRGIQICYGIKGRMTGWRNMDLEFFLFFGPQNQDKIGYKTFTLHPTSFDAIF